MSAASALPQPRAREAIAEERRRMLRRLAHYMRRNARLYGLGIATTLVYAVAWWSRGLASEAPHGPLRDLRRCRKVFFGQSQFDTGSSQSR